MNLSLTRLASVAFKALDKEKSVLQTLNEDVKATVKRMVAADPGLQGLLENAHGYAVFPSVGKASAVIGGAFGKGEVFENGKLVGYAGLVQVTIGVQIGGETFSEIIAFESKQALERFKRGRTAFAANASAVLVKAGAAKSAGFEAGAAVFVSPEGGMMLEAAIGAQKFIFKPAVLGRTRTAPDAKPGQTGTTTRARKAGAPSKPARRQQPGKNAGEKSRTGSAASRGAKTRSTGTAARSKRPKSRAGQRASR